MLGLMSLLPKPFANEWALATKRNGLQNIELMRYVQLSASQIVCYTGVETLFVSLGLNCPIIEASKLSLL